MKAFDFKITDPVGIHARNALFLSKKAGQYKSDIWVFKESCSADAKNLMTVMAMRVKCGDTVHFTVEGADEEEAYLGIKGFCQGNL